MIKRVLYLMVLLMIHGFIYAVDVQDALKYLEDKVLNIEIITRIVDEKGITIWDREMSKITISGKSVKVKLSGVNLLAITDITPYVMDDSTILLVSQGEIWIGLSKSDEMRHYSTIKSIPVISGESVLFFPLGLIKVLDTAIHNIELEIQVNKRIKNMDN